MLLVMCVFFVYGAVEYWDAACTITPISVSLWSSLGDRFSCEGWVSWVTVNAMVHSIWVTTLFGCQLYQVRLLKFFSNTANKHYYFFLFFFRYPG